MVSLVPFGAMVMDGATAVIMDGRISKRKSWSMGSWFGRGVGIKSGSFKGRVASPKSTYPWEAWSRNATTTTMRVDTKEAIPFTGTTDGYPVTCVATCESKAVEDLEEKMQRRHSEDTRRECMDRSTRETRRCDVCTDTIRGRSERTGM